MEDQTQQPTNFSEIREIYEEIIGLNSWRSEKLVDFRRNVSVRGKWSVKDVSEILWKTQPDEIKKAFEKLVGRKNLRQKFISYCKEEIGDEWDILTVSRILFGVGEIDNVKSTIYLYNSAEFCLNRSIRKLKEKLGNDWTMTSIAKILWDSAGGQDWRIASAIHSLGWLRQDPQPSFDDPDYQYNFIRVYGEKIWFFLKMVGVPPVTDNFWTEIQNYFDTNLTKDNIKCRLDAFAKSLEYGTMSDAAKIIWNIPDGTLDDPDDRFEFIDSHREELELLREVHIPEVHDDFLAAIENYFENYLRRMIKNNDE
ncbi:MAG: hypothetical protein Satyrvirus6_30 [Satyrvirus sp.]|uniref:Uncharacterized protein n=1 Tax=Satyrvirus sp. TaxID=2487771 RepID=A0A3G5ADK0_9VIRU|nr:MAG: hypothetical protein Satyrvirus6_30 [Satyrvirus sp.]